jgi:hypothetical protein
MTFDRRTSPILICGRVRSGTTFARALLESHPDIAISDEFPIWEMPSLPGFLQEATRNFRSVERGDWDDRRAGIIRAIWFNYSNDERLEKGMRSRRYGNKTPAMEWRIPFYEKAFAKTPPLYVYMLREGERVFASRNAMPWRDAPPPVERQLRQYLNSLRWIEEFREEHPARVMICQLDRIEPTYEARRKATETLLDFLGESIDPAMEGFIREWRSVHTLGDIKESPPRAVLPPKDKELLEENEEYQQAMRRYGYR